MATIHVLRNLLPLESVKLGRLLLNANHPLQDFIDPLADRPTESEVSLTFQTNSEETLKFSKTSKFQPYLSDVFSIRYERHDGNSTTLSAPQATTHNLKNAETWFKSVCTEPATQRFLGVANDNWRSAYLVVGIRTVQNAKLVKCVPWERVQKLKVEVPAKIVVAPASIATSVLDAGAGGNMDTGDDQWLTYNAPGEQVFAIVYRKVKLKRLSNHDTSLGNCQWKRDMGLDKGDKESMEDVLEASLTSDLDITDEEHASEDESYFFQDIEGVVEGLEQQGHQTLQPTTSKSKKKRERRKRSIALKKLVVEDGANCSQELPGLEDVAGGLEHDHQALQARKKSKKNLDRRRRWAETVKKWRIENGTYGLQGPTGHVSTRKA